MKWIKWVGLIALAWLPGIASGANLTLSSAGTIVNVGVYENVTVSAANCRLYNTTITGTLTVSESVELRSCDVYEVTFGAASKTLTAWCTGFETQTEAAIEAAGTGGTVTATDCIFNTPARRDRLNRPANPTYHKCNRSDAP
jgi:hypothetical protein